MRGPPMKLFHRPFVQVLLILIAVLIFASVMSKYFPLPPEFFCMENLDGPGCEKVRQSLCPDCQLPGPIEAWFDLMLAFWLLFFLQFLWMPRKWVKAILETMFPFLPPPND